MDVSLSNLSSISKPKPLQPWEMLFRPVRKSFWRESFPEQDNFTTTDRWSFDVFLRGLETYINGEQAWLKAKETSSQDFFVLSSEERDKLRRLVDPWGTGLVTVEQLNYLEEFFDEPIADESIYALINEIMKIDTQSIRKPLQKYLSSHKDHNEAVIKQIEPLLDPSSRTRIFVINGEDGTGKSSAAIRIMQNRKQELGIDEKYLFFYCDIRACFSPNAIICEMARAIRLPLLGDQDPYGFFSWIRLHKTSEILFVIDNLEKTTSATTALGATVGRIIDTSKQFRFIVLSSNNGVKNALISCGVTSSIIEEFSACSLTTEQSREIMMDSLHDKSLIDSIDIPTNPGHIAFMANAINRGFRPSGNSKSTTFASIIQHLVDLPLHNTISIPWAPGDRSAGSLLIILHIFRDFFDAQSAAQILSSVTHSKVSEEKLHATLNELIERGLVEETTGKAYGRKYAIPKFVKTLAKPKSGLSISTKESLNDQFTKYFCNGLSSAGESLLWGNYSSAFQFFDENHSDITSLLLGKLSHGCVLEFISVVRYAHKILRTRLSASDQVQFYVRVLELLQGDLERYESMIITSYLKSRLSASYLALDDVQEAKNQAKHAVSVLKSGGTNKPTEDDAEYLNALSTALEREADAFSNPALLEQALDMKTKCLGDHPETCEAYYKLGLMLESNQRTAHALDIYKRGLAIMKKVIPNHLTTALCEGKIGNILRLYRQPVEAYETFIESLWVCEDALGKRHSLVGMNKYWIALSIMEKPGRKDLVKLKEAEKYAQDALKTLAVSHEPGHYETNDAYALWTKITRQISTLTSFCVLCNMRFTFFYRRHRCRSCGNIVCSSCSPKRGFRPVPEMGRHACVRVCFKCFRDAD